MVNGVISVATLQRHVEVTLEILYKLMNGGGLESDEDDLSGNDIQCMYVLTIRYVCIYTGCLFYVSVISSIYIICMYLLCTYMYMVLKKINK